MNKLCFQIIFITLILQKQANSIILTDEKVSNQERWLILKDEVMTKIKALVGSSKTEIVYNENECGKYDPKDVKKRVEICISKHSESDNSISLEFRNPNNRFELSFSNIDINSLSSDIKLDPYVEEFVKSLEELVFDANEKKDSIKKAIQKGAEDAKATVVSLDDSKLVFKYEEKENTINYSITGDMLEFSTDFFQDSIDLNIPLKKFIEFETKKLVADVIEHLHLMKQFALSDGETAAQSIKTINCKSIMENNVIMNGLKTRLDKDKITVSQSDTTVTIGKDGKDVKVTCEEKQVGDFSLIEIKADFTVVSSQINPVTQTFLSKSLYNLLPVIQSFFNDLGVFVTRILSDSNVSEDFDAVQ